MTFDNGVRAVYEGSVSHPVGLNTFYKEYIRVDGENGTAILHHRDVEVFIRQDIWRQQHREGEGQKIAPIVQPKWINHWLIEKFARWRDGGEPMETRVEENVQASALVFAAIQSSRSGTPVRVQSLVDWSLKRETTDGDAKPRQQRPARLAGRPRLQQLRRAARRSRRPGVSCTARSTKA